tara:strand:- start:58 stop:624 length:567 start_codon:yes stop_codon:yes gene_type:complete
VIITGIDYSMRSPSICVFVGLDDETFSFQRCKFYFLTDTKRYAAHFLENIFGEMFSKWDDDSERYKSISDWAIEKIVGSDQIAIEGYSYNSTGKVFHIAENTGILKYKIYNLGIPLEVVPPSSVKKLATGKGNADKEWMHKHFVTETGLNLKEIITPKKSKVDNPVSDIIDSYYICKHLYKSIKSTSS